MDGELAASSTTEAAAVTTTLVPLVSESEEGGFGAQAESVWSVMVGDMEEDGGGDDDVADGSGSDGGGSENEEADATGAAAATGVVDGDALDDEQLLLVVDKKEAKQLGRKAYKRWKKLQKRQGKGDKKSSKRKSKDVKKKKEKKKSSSKKEKGASKKSTRKRARADSDEDEDDLPVGDAFFDGTPPFMTEDDAVLLGEAGAVARRAGDAAARKNARREQMLNASAPKPKKLTALEEQKRLATFATMLVREMQQARDLDERATCEMRSRDHQQQQQLSSQSSVRSSPVGPPLHRVAIKHKVEASCLRRNLIGPLVEAGILQELSTWIFDLEHQQPAPFELRTTALDMLLRFPIQGEMEPLGNARRVSRNGDLVEIDLGFTGIEWEHLRTTNLGRAVNALRVHQQEIPENRSKCVRLLERLSRAKAGGGEEEDRRRQQHHLQRGAAVLWHSQGDKSVASPFEVVATSSEAFQKAQLRPDPRDPTSYNNLLPWRPPVTAITNLSGTLAKQIVEQ